MYQYPEVEPPPDSAFSLPPDTVAFYVDHQEQRDRLTSFFRMITAIPPMIWVAIWGVGAAFVMMFAWFAVVFTAKFPPGLYDFLVRYNRYYAKVSAYMYLATDKYPGYSGDPNVPYAAHLLIGPPKATYSRVMAFFRLIIYIPFGIVVYVLTYGYQLAAVAAWFMILFTGKQPKGLQDVLTYCLGFCIRTQIWLMLLTEDWPKFSDDEVNRALWARGYQGTIPPGAPVAAIAQPQAYYAPPGPPAPPAPPGPPGPPAPPAPPSV
jgi:hypothetical protein